MSEKTWIKLSDGLAIYKMKQSKNWYLRFRFEGVEYPAKSLRTADQTEATAEAFFIYKAAQKKIETEFLQKKSRTLGYICNKINKNLLDKEKNNTGKALKNVHKENLRYIRNLKRLSEKFGKVDIKDFDYAYLVSFFSDYNQKISETEFRYINMTLNKVFEYALMQRLINSIPAIPKIKIKARKQTNYFNKHDYQIILSHIKSRKIKSGIATENNTLLYHLIQFITATGIRPGEEISEIKCKDLQVEMINGNSYWTLKITGGKVATKDGLKRKIILSGDAVSQIKHLLISELNIHLTGGDLELIKYLRDNKERTIFSRKNGKVPDFSKLFGDAIKQISDKLIESDLVPYSGRHTFITNQLKRNANIHIVAKHCGTSVEMIEKTYNHLLSLMKPQELLEFEYVISSPLTDEFIKNSDKNNLEYLQDTNNQHDYDLLATNEITHENNNEFKKLMDELNFDSLNLYNKHHSDENQ